MYMTISNRHFLTIDGPLDEADRLIGHGGMEAFVPIPSTASPAHTHIDIWRARLSDDADLTAVVEEDAVTDEPTQEQILEALEAQAEVEVDEKERQERLERQAYIEEYLDGLDTVAYYYGVGYFDHQERSDLALGADPEEVDKMKQQMQNETKEERENRLIRLGCPCAEDLKELRRKRMTVSPAEAEKLDVEFGAQYGYPNLLIMTAQDRIRLGCPMLADDAVPSDVVEEDALTDEPTPEQIQEALEADAAEDVDPEFCVYDYRYDYDLTEEELDARIEKEAQDFFKMKYDAIRDSRRSQRELERKPGVRAATPSVADDDEDYFARFAMHS